MEPEPLSIIDKGSYLLVEFFGEFSVNAGKQCVDRMVEACEKHRRSRVLLDCRRMTGKLGVFDRFEVTEYGASKRDQLMRFALLNRKDVVLPDNFVENVAVNRGMNMKVFTDFDEAEHWLTRSFPNTPDIDGGK
jgi:hypothetical protein